MTATNRTMKRLVLALAIVTFLAAWAGADEHGSAEPAGLSRLLDAIATVESRNDPGAAGDGGAALGSYQIHRAYWADGIRFLGVSWSYRHAKDPVKAREVVRAYLLHYGQGKNLLDMARIHNGGPNGHRKRATLEYARRVDDVLREMANS